MSRKLRVCFRVLELERRRDWLLLEEERAERRLTDRDRELELERVRERRETERLLERAGAIGE